MANLEDYHQINLLPSIAIKFYEIEMKRKYFDKLKLYIFERRKIWRLILRANVHYKFNIKRKYFCAWLTFRSANKAKKIKYKRAVDHNCLKLKRKYFYYVAFYPLVKLLLIVCERLLTLCIYYLFFNYNILYLHLDAITCRRNYLILLYSRDKHYTKLCGKALTTLHDHAIFKRHKREINAKSRNFFMAKNYPQYLRRYVRTWITFANDSIRKRCQMCVAEEFYNERLMKKCIKKLMEYKNYNRTKRSNTVLATTFFAVKLKIKYFKALSLYHRRRLLKYKNLQRAGEFFMTKLKLQYFLVIQHFAKEEQQYRTALVSFNRKIAGRCLQHLRTYAASRKEKNFKKFLALEHYEIKLKTVFFRALLKNCKHYRKLTEKSDSLYYKKLLSKYLCTWKKFMSIKREKQLKRYQSKQHLEAKIKTKYFKLWKVFIRENRILITNLESILIRWTFRKWKRYYNEVVTYEKKKAEALTIYNNSLIRRGLKVIVSSGLLKQTSKDYFILQRNERSLKIAAKYFRIWKSKVIIPKSSIGNISAENNLQFQWNPICFEEPRIPSFLNTIKY